MLYFLCDCRVSLASIWMVIGAIDRPAKMLEPWLNCYFAHLPLFRLLAINLAAGAAAAVLLLGGLLVNPHGLRGLIFAVASATAIGLLLFGC